MSFGDNIRKHRKAAGLTRDDLACLLQVEEKDIAFWERGLKSPDEALIPRIASSLGVSAQEIAGEMPLNGDIRSQAEFSDGDDLDSTKGRDFSLKILTPLDDMLKKGENLIWAGKPSRGKGTGVLSLVRLASSYLWIVMLLYWIIKAVFMYPPTAFLGAPLIVAGVIWIVLRIFRIKKQKENTYYAITDERVIIKSRRKNEDEAVKSISLNDIHTIRIEEGGNGFGNIIFIDKDVPSGNAQPQSYPLRILKTKSFDIPLNGFYGIEGVNKVCDVLRSILD
ncbi:MAG: helix-turn-helix domain-containing protein [Acutalibacteraceae bacterium]